MNDWRDAKYSKHQHRRKSMHSEVELYVSHRYRSTGAVPAFQRMPMASRGNFRSAGFRVSMKWGKNDKDVSATSEKNEP